MTVLNLENTLSLVMNENPLHFIMVGAGGTGGHLVSNLVRMVSIKNESRDSRNRHSVTIIDGDNLEEKNLLRQNFTHKDIGKNKAEVLANRYGRAYGETVGYVPEYLKGPYDLLNIIHNILEEKNSLELLERELTEEDTGLYASYMNSLDSYGYLPIVVLIDCTDNGKTRLMLHEVTTTYGDISGTIIYLSSGNEEYSGQVVMGMSTPDRGCFGYSLERSGPNDNTYNSLNLPTFYNIFPNTPLERMPTELSCAEASVSAPQNISANVTAANILFDYINRLLNHMPIQESAVFFDTRNMARSVYRFNKTDMTKLLSMVPNNRALHTCFRDASLKLTHDVEPLNWNEVLAIQEEEEEKRKQRAQDLLDGILVEVEVEEEEDTNDDDELSWFFSPEIVIEEEEDEGDSNEGDLTPEELMMYWSQRSH